MNVKNRVQVQRHTLLAAERPRYLYEYAVEGMGNFPLDMLRYDSAWPADQESLDYMLSRGRRRVLLRSYKEPTPARWESFLWRVMGWHA